MEIVEQILDKTKDGLEVFYTFLPANFKVGKKFLNPLYEDKRASCYVYYNKKHRRYMLQDFGNPTFNGDCFNLVARIYNLDTQQPEEFNQILGVIIENLHLSIAGYRPAKTFTADRFPLPVKVIRPKQEHMPKEVKSEGGGPVPYCFDKRNFTSKELLFWNKYGIDTDTLLKYNVVFLKTFSSEGENGPYTYRSSSDSPIFGYCGDGFLKLYRPMARVRFLYAGSVPTPYCFGLKQLPSRGDLLFLTGGEKDVMSLAAHGFNAICFNSETAVIPRSTIEMLHMRFKHIIVMYDCDETGIASMERASKELADFKVLTLHLPLSGEKTDKDVSDFFAGGHTAQELRDLIRAQIEQIHVQSLLLMKTCEMDYSNPPTRSKTVISAADVPLGTYDNLLCITGGEGTGKSNFVSALVAGALLTKDTPLPIDTLGFKVTPNYDSKVVLHFDTEQSEYQLYKNVENAVRRAMLDIKPSFYKVYYMVTLTRQQRMQLIRDSMDILYQRYGGIHLVVIDGIADLVRSANDEAESIATVEELYRLAGLYHTCIVCVLHFVPNGIKLRGHIGSELQRKASCILSIERDDKANASMVKTLKVRDGNPLEVPLLLFKWDDDSRMFVYAGQKKETGKSNRKMEMYLQLVKDIFVSNEYISSEDLCQKIREKAEVAERTAKDYIQQMVHHDLIVRNANNYYTSKRH